MTFPRKGVILAAHRWLGLAAALFLLVLAVTGLLLNHTEGLRLDEVRLTHPVLLEHYGMPPRREVEAYALGGSGDLTVVGTTDQLVLLDAGGDVVEIFSSQSLPYAQLTGTGATRDGGLVLVTDSGNWVPDPDWLGFEAYAGAVEPAALVRTELTDAAREALLQQSGGEGVTLYRLLLDLHSGRLFGVSGRTVMDLSAVAILLLVASGVSGWLRRPSRPSGGPRD